VQTAYTTNILKGGVTGTQQQRRTTMSSNKNLEALNQACAGMQYTDMMCFKAMFIGSLASRVSEKDWNESLEIIKDVLKKEGRDGTKSGR
jgi:hypothetical protein